MTVTSILLASGNPHKREEILRAVGLSPDALILPEHVAADPPDPIEDGATYEANACLKARAFSAWSGRPALADDTGLEVDALDGRPGLFSARYAGEAATYEDNVQLLLRELAGVPFEKRRARFVTVLVICDGDELLYRVEGVCPGTIALGPRGTAGFGYDPVFVPEGETKTFAELAPHQKDGISHRGRALARLREDIREGRFPLQVRVNSA